MPWVRTSAGGGQKREGFGQALGGFTTTELKMRSEVSKLISQLEKMSPVQRASAIAHDVKSRKDIFRSIGPHGLMKLLGLDPHAEPWERGNYVWLQTVEEFLEQYIGSETDAVLDYLASTISQERLQKLDSKLQSLETVTADDLRKALSEGELRDLLRAEAERRMEHGDYVPLAFAEVENQEGVPLKFSYWVGDQGEVEDLLDPYDFRDGKFHDTATAAIAEEW